MVLTTRRGESTVESTKECGFTDDGRFTLGPDGSPPAYLSENRKKLPIRLPLPWALLISDTHIIVGIGCPGLPTFKTAKSGRQAGLAQGRVGHPGRSVRTWETESGRCMAALIGRQKGSKVVFGSDRRRACNSRRTIELWDTLTGRHVRTFPQGSPGSLPRISAFSPDGRLLVSTHEGRWNTDAETKGPGET